MATGSPAPWEVPIDDSYWQSLLNEAEREAPDADFSTGGLPDSPDPVDVYAEASGQSGSPSDFSSDQNFDDSAREDTDNWWVTKESGTPSHVADEDSDWKKAAEIFEAKETVHLKVTGFNRGGLLVMMGRVQGFVPASQLCHLPGENDREADLACRVGHMMELRIIEIDQRSNRLIFSERAARRERGGDVLLKSLAPGQVWEGQVSSLCAFGAFVDLGGVEGFIHISEFSWGRVDRPSDVLKPGDKIKVYVVSVEPTQCRVSLSLKRLIPNPWKQVEERYEVGQMVEGQVTNVVSFGAFVRVEEGLEGLIHVSELAEGNFLHPRNVIKEGEQVTARVIRIDSANHRLGLSLRQTHLPQ
jgi:small subunit ribosomal protein S1